MYYTMPIFASGLGIRHFLHADVPTSKTPFKDSQLDGDGTW